MKKSFAFNNRKGQKIELLENKHKQGIFEKGIRNIKDLLAPAAIYRNSPDDLEIDGLYSRSFVINGYPNSTYVGCLRDLFDYEVDMDVAIYIEPADERSALMELTAEITKAETQLRSDKERGKIDNITVLEAKINKLVQQRIKLEQNIETMFYCAIFGTLYESSIGKLNKEMQKLDNKLIGNRIKIMPLYLRQDDAYKTVLPYGKCYINDFFRNINTGALTGIFPFYNAEISHPNGTFMGINIATATPIYLDWYNKNYLDNANGFLFGKSGSGKTYLVSLLTLRSCIDGIHTAIIDVESEYGKVTRAVGGIIVKFEPMEKFKLNFFDIEAEEVLSDDGMPTGSWIVNIKDKCANALNLIAVMSQGLLTPDMQSGVSYVLMKMYSDFNITENPDSLYESLPGSEFDEKTGKFRYDKFRKKMPQMTDFYNGLLKYAKETNDERFYKLADSMKIFVNGGIYDMFDCQTTMDIDFMKVLVITFDVSKLEENLLRPIGMYIALNWIWEKFAKKDVKIKKRILVDRKKHLTHNPIRLETNSLNQ